MWANMPDGAPIPGIRVPEDLYRFLQSLQDAKAKSKKNGKRGKR